MKKLYYILLKKYYLRKINALVCYNLSFEECSNGEERRKIFYRYDHALDMLYHYGLIEEVYFLRTTLKLIDNARLSNYSSFSSGT